MMTQIKWFLTPPAFEDDHKTRQAKLLNTIIKLAFLVLIVPTITALTTSRHPIFSLIPVVSTFIFFIIILVVLGQGYTQFASILFVSINWLIIMATAIFFGGVNGSAFPFFVIPVLMAGLLLSWQAAIGFTTLTILAGLALLYIEYAGLLPQSLATNNLINIWAIRTSFLVMMTVLVYIATRYLDQTLEQTQELVEARTAELTAANKQLRYEISERKQAEQALQQQRDFAMTIMEALGQGVTVSEYGKGFVYVNPAYARMLGYQVEELIGKFPTDFTLSTDEIILNQARVARQTGKTTNYELRMQRKDGTIVPVLVTGVPRWQEGEIIGAIVISTDLTERKQIEEDLRRRGAILETVAFAAEQFLMGNSWEECIQAVLARLGQATNASRVYIAENYIGAAGALFSRQRYEWTGPDITPQLNSPQLQNLPWQPNYARWQTLLSQGYPIHSHTNTLPKQEAQMLIEHDIQSIVLMPIFVGQQWWGLIGFDDCVSERDWPAVEIDTLKVAAATLGAAVGRNQIQEALRASEAQARQAHIQLEDAIESLTEAFALYDADDRMVLCNSKYHEFYHMNVDMLIPGVGFEEQIRASIQRGSVPAAIGREEEWVKERLVQHQNPKGIYLQQLNDGRWLRISERKTRDGGVVGVRTDITELVEKEQSLQDSERHYRGLFENSPISLWEQDFSAVKVYIDNLRRQGIENFEAFFEEHSEAVKECIALVKTVDMNQAAVELYQASTKSNLLGSLDKLISAEAHNIFREGLIYISQGRTHFRTESINTTLTGEKIYIDLSWSVAPGHEDTFSKVYVSIIDITERKKVEESLRQNEQKYRQLFADAQRQTQELMLLGKIRTTLARELDLANLFRITVEAIAEILGYKQVNLYLLKGDTLYLQHQVGYIQIFPTIPITKGVGGRVARTGVPALVKDASADSDFLFIVEGAKSEVCVPLFDQNQVAGVLILESASSTALSQADLELMIALSEHISIAIERARLYTQVRESEKRLRQIIDLVPHFIFAKDREGRFIFANRASAESLGATPETIVGKSELELLPIKQDAYAFQKIDLEVISSDQKKFIPEEKMTDVQGNLHYLQTVKIPFTAPGTQETAVLGVAVDITERKLAEEALRESEERFRVTFEQAAVGIAHVGLDNRWLRVNQKLCDIMGYSREELLNQSFTNFTYPDTLEANREYLQQLVAGEIQNYTLEKRYFHKEGALIWANVTVSLLRSPDGEPKYLISVIEDITRRKRLEEQLRQSQKLEAIGRLAGGIAHDFNNILTVIIGNSELALLTLPKDNPLYADINQIGQAAERAASLTRQLLAFSRQQVLQPITLNLNMVVTNIETLLRRLIGEHIELVTRLEPKLGQIKADPGQFEQVIVNLAVNARDVMPQGGRLTIETTNVNLVRHDPDLEATFNPGLYIRLTICDTGPGIPPEIQTHIFEPFFTTKEVGQGTGLGLATVHGIIEQSGGFIKVDSVLQQGTTFKIFLPAIKQAAQPSLTQPAVLPPSGGFETILLVEDEDEVRSLARQILESNGYNILEAADGPAALQLAQQRHSHIHLLITDVLMPGGLNGPQLAQKLTSLYPQIKVLYMSGYTHNTLADQGLETPTFAFIEKPFTPQQFTQKIRQVLDG